MRKFIAVALVLFAISATQEARAGETDSSDYDIRANVGVRSMFFYLPLAIPSTLSTIVTFDIGKYFRIQLDVSPFNFVEDKFFRISSATGVAFTVYGNESKRRGGWEIVIPAMAEAGYLFGWLSVFGSEHISTTKWFVVGPSSGADFTWWSRKGKEIGFNLSLKVSYLFRRVDMDIDSYYTEDYSDDTYGFADVAVTFGIAL